MSAFKRVSADGLFHGVGSAAFISIKVGVAILLIFSFTSMIEGQTSRNILDLIPFAFFYLLVSSVVTVIASLLIGIPITVLLVYLHMEDELLSALLGLLIVVFWFIIFESDRGNGPLLYCIYGFFCGYGFMKGYKKS